MVSAYVIVQLLTSNGASHECARSLLSEEDLKAELGLYPVRERSEFVVRSPANVMLDYRHNERSAGNIPTMMRA